MKGRNIADLKSSLSLVDWNSFTDENNVDSSFEHFHSILLKQLDENCPEKNLDVPVKHLIREPWLTKGLTKCQNKQKKLYKLLLTEKTSQVEQKYRLYRNTLQRIIRRAKREYYNNQCLEFRRNSKKLWNLVNKIHGKQNDKSTVIDFLKIDNIEKYNSESITNEFGKYFSSVGKTCTENISKSTNSIAHYLNKMNNNPKSVFLAPCTEAEILSIINKLPNKKSCGYDGVSNILLKEIKEEISPFLCRLFNSSMRLGIFPTLMKHAEVVPLYKAGLKHLVTRK